MNDIINRCRHPTKKGFVSIDSFLDDIKEIELQDVPTDLKMGAPSKSIMNTKTPISRMDNLKFSVRHPTNVPGWKSYSMKNTSCGRLGASKDHSNIDLHEHREVLEEIMKQTFINDKLVIDHFQDFTKHPDMQFKEFQNAVKDLNLDHLENAEIQNLYDDIRGKDKRAMLEDIDIVVQCTVKRNIQE